MKFQAASSVLLSLVSAVAGQYDTTIPSPVCAKFKQFTVGGIGEFVDTDASGIAPQTTGDMSVSFSLTGVNAAGEYPNQSIFRNLNIDMNAICVVKKDQPFVPVNAPVCLYEAKFSFCRRNYIIFQDDIKIEKVKAERVVDIRPALEKLGRLERTDGDGRRTQSQSVRGAGQAAEVVGAESNLEDDNRQLQKELFEDNIVNEGLVEAVFVTEEVYALDEELFKLVCPKLGCLIPYYFCTDKRKGGFTAHGTGSQDIKITGGTAGLFGAFGQMITPTSGIDIISTDLMTGDITYEFDIDLEICYYRRESGFW